MPETAARGFTAIATRMLAGGKQVDAAFRSIGMSRKKFMADVNKDAPAALIKLFETLSKHKQGMNALIEIAGRDFADDFAKLLKNPELLAQAMQLVAEKSAYAGSAVEEADKQASGAVQQWNLLKNRLSALAITIGDVLLPPVIELMDTIGNMLTGVMAWAGQHPELTSAIVKTVATVMLLNIALRLLRFTMAGTRLGLINLMTTFLKFDKNGRNIATG